MNPILDIETKKPIDPNLLSMCTQTVQHLINLPGFQLIKIDDFIQLVYARCQFEIIQKTELNIRNITLNIYSEQLYRAVGDLVLQENGFLELSKYLFRMAYNFYLHQSSEINEASEKAQECTQLALERIFMNLANVRLPGGFLKWCGTILRNICLEDVRKKKNQVSLDDEDPRIKSLDEENDCIQESMNEQECLKKALLRLNEEHIRVIQMTYFSNNENGEKICDEEIARILNINIGNLYTKRARALAALRKDKVLINCIQKGL